MVMAGLLRLLGVPLVLGPLAVALKLHLLGMQLLPRVRLEDIMLICFMGFLLHKSHVGGKCCSFSTMENMGPIWT